MPLPDFNHTGDRPPGVHRATLAEVIKQFGQGRHDGARSPVVWNESTDWPLLRIIWLVLWSSDHS